MTETLGSATAWLRMARKSWLLWGGVACYLFAAPFLLLITWGAAQVWVGGTGYVLDLRRINGNAAVSLALHHAIPFAIFGVASLAVAFIGGALLHRAVGQMVAEVEAA